VSEREELFQIIWDGAVDDRVKDGKDLARVPVVRPKVWALVHGILAAGFKKPRTVTTVEELDALPLGSVVRCGHGRVYERDYVETNPRDTTWWIETGSTKDYQSSSIELPATVIYEGEWEA
jgi:hypothetical protein